MRSRETLECRIYMAEDAMYRRSDDLNRHLHELESRLKDLVAEVHQALREEGRTPLEAKTGRIVQAIEGFHEGIDLARITAEAERVSSLKGLIADFEREVAESAPRRRSETTSSLQALAATAS
jgi:hypothetical protein